MERLTYIENGTTFGILERRPGEQKEWVAQGLSIDKLAKYEDLEEQELLVTLPCKIGTDIFFIQYCTAPSCKKCGCNNRYGDCIMTHKARIRDGKFSLFFLNAFGKSVFLTREEAEAVLNNSLS